MTSATHDPRATSAVLTPRGRCSLCGAAQVRFATDGMGQLIEVANPCVHLRPRRALPDPEPTPRIPLPTPDPKEKKVSIAGKRNLGADEMRAEIREVLQAQPDLTQTDARRAIEERTGCARINSGTFHGRWHSVRKQMDAETQAPPAEPNPAKQKQPAAAPSRAETAVVDAALGEVAHGNGGAQAAEIQSLRTTYDTGQYVRIEEEDGVWCLRVAIDFPTRSEAMNALTALMGIVE